jgi:hypothetical protein
VEVTGSNPVPPINKIKGLQDLFGNPFLFFATILLTFCYPNKPKQDKTRGKTKTVFPLVYWFLPKNSYHQKLPKLPQHQKAQLATPAL